MTSIQLRDIRKSFGAFDVIKGIDMEIKSGEFMVFVGPSGCGKSTLLRLICGLEEITGGELSFEGQVVNRLTPANRGVAMVFQSYALYPHMTVFENMAFGLKLAGSTKDERRKRVEAAAEMLQLTPYLQRLPKQLSGGQRQRVAIGRAIVRDPKVFLFDEPLSNLDAALRVATRLEIAKLNRSMPDTTMIYVTHDQVEAMTLADRICVLRDGRVEQVGTPLELYETPVNTFVAGFIGSPQMNFLTGKHADTYGAHTIGIRPEHIVAGDGANGWTGDIVHAEMLGSDSYIYVDIGAGQPVVVREDGVSNRQTGHKLTIAPLPEHIHRFDAQGNALPKTQMRAA
ncbi:ABC transporter ATP-binding protein [Agrobacterium rosae]|uniref:ATP-binding cassette domain-containing protein n=1 Tax=Agrobacterium rosae TaxID=1972867 RepID=A0A1R3TN78_9HYPH|nr:ATP-binding cassette domain-containing protein [Agrobacterium rosae]KAA3515919.1 ATP-binding cassette domain-containing protein [Agrobacterium rosae]KAA3524872.1 ATP-binding cassette domain-containing protein [Agrobacterium rosae]MCM2431838.1 ATP-binding cassette domain-containing protein [Agrobacterium rosae]MDX8305342.1 ATP-binding cassette domain-containing protein [Agrobacterium rosae]MDX8328496.1 ATP-binding cassette domain-containing protein [Agrobacterium rosae]